MVHELLARDISLCRVCALDCGSIVHTNDFVEVVGIDLYRYFIVCMVCMCCTLQSVPKSCSIQLR
jgi:hypothetical protein